MVHKMQRVSEHTDLERHGSLMVEPFRTFTKIWLEAFQECSLDPENKPTILCPSNKLNEARSVASIAAVVAKEAPGKLPNFSKSDGSRAQELLQQVERDKEETHLCSHTSLVAFVCSCYVFWERWDKEYPYPGYLNIFFLRILVISWWHMVLMFSSVAGVGLAVHLHRSLAHVTAVCVDIALVFVAVLIALEPTLSDSLRLDRELKEVERQQQDVEEIKHNFQVWVDEYNKVTNLWRYQTMNKLDLVEAIWGILDFPKKIDQSIERSIRLTLKTLNKKLQATLDGMGSASMYLDPTDQEDEIQHMENASKQMRTSIDRISEAAAQQNLADVELYLDNFFTMLIVYIDQASDLPNKDGGVFFDRKGDLTDAYVLLRAGKVRRRDAPRTKTIQDSLNPSWEEEFYLEVPIDVKVLTLEVFDDDEDQWVGAKREGVGYLNVEFRHTTGQWVQKSDRLLSFPHGEEMDAKINFQYFFATSLQELSRLDDSMGPNWRNYKSISMARIESLGAFLRR